MTSILLLQLENMLGGDEKFQERVTAHLVPCIAQFSVAMADDSLWKPLNYHILLKMRHTSSKVGSYQNLFFPVALENVKCPKKQKWVSQITTEVLITVLCYHQVPEMHATHASTPTEYLQYGWLVLVGVLGDFLLSLLFLLGSCLNKN